MGLAVWVAVLPASADGNRLAHLERTDPYYPGLVFPKLVTPQWAGEPGMEAAVVLAVDDLLDNNVPRFEVLLRPVLERLKQIGGRHRSASWPTASVRMTPWSGAGWLRG